MKKGLLALLVVVLRAAVAQETLDFEHFDIKEKFPPLIFTCTMGGSTDNQIWEIQETSGAPSGKKVLAITKGEAIQTVFPVALLRGKENKFQNVEVSVKFRILGGTVGRAGGLAVRAVDVDHCYLVCASALDNTIVMYRINKEEHTKIGSGKANVSDKRWHTIKVVAKGGEMECYFNGSRVFGVSDATYLSGKVGLVSHADSVTQFDDLTVSVPSSP